MLRQLKLRLFRRREIRAELESHLDQIADDLIAGGMDPHQARAAARRRFGNLTHLQEQSRDLFSFRHLEDLLADLRYGWRSIRRSPSVAVAAVLSMGLAIGVNTVVFSLVREVFFSRPTTRDAGDLISIRLGGGSHASLPNLRDLDASGAFERVAGFDLETTVNWRDGDTTRQTPVMLVSENYFDLLETPALLGRVFHRAEARAELNPHLVVITHRLWTQGLAADPGIVGRDMVLNGRPYTVVGVLPDRFRPPTYLNALPDLYVPASPEINPSLLKRQSSALMLIARRKPGQRIPQAYAALQVVAGRLEHDHAEANTHLARSIQIFPVAGYQQYLDPDAAPLVAFAALLLIAVFVVLWIACVNVAGLLIARAAARRREIATRLAIGAARGRIVRQLLAESLLLATLGTIAGLTLHWYLARLLTSLSLPLPIPIVFQLSPDLTLLLYSIALTALAALLAGLAPAWQATRPGLTSGLKMEEPQYGFRRLTFRNGLVVVQVATTMILLSTGLLFTRSLARVESMKPGFDLEHTVWAKITVLSDRYPKEQLYRFASRALTAAAVPGVQSAALTSVVPFNNFMRNGSMVRTTAGSTHLEYFSTRVSPAYFETMGIPIVAGRPFQPGDRMGAPGVVVLNGALAWRLFGDGPAVGQAIWFGDGRPNPTAEVVGVAANSKHMTMGEKQAYAVYEPIAQSPSSRTGINVIARAAGDAGSIVPALQQALTPLDETAAVEVGPLRTRLAFAYLPSRIGAVLLGSLGVLALTLALIGIYGAMAFAVSRRTAEIGIRIALGATNRQVLRAVLGGSFATVLAGMAIGVVLALAAARPLAFFLVEGVTPMDPLTFASAIAICLIAGGVGAVLPARRALSVDPLNALRVE